MTGIHRPPPWVLGSAAALLIAVAAVIALSLPQRFFVGTDRGDSGVRLLRDDKEVSYYLERTRWFDDRVAPYTPGHELEYPPLAAIYFVLPRLFSSDPGGYLKGFAALNAVMFGLLIGLTAALLRRHGQPIGRLALLFLPAFLYGSLWRFDLLPAVLVAWFLWAVDRERPVAAALAMAAAALAKYYPVLFLAPYGLYFLARRPDRALRRRVIIGLAILAGLTAAVMAVIVALAGWQAVSAPLKFHLDRKFEIHSLGIMVLVGLYFLDIGGDRVLRAVTAVFYALQFGGTAVLLFCARITDRRSFIRACLFVLMPFMLFARFFSPQWILWLTPVYLLAATPWELGLLAVLDIVLYLQFPVLYDISPDFRPFLGFNLVRSAIVAGLVVLNIRAMLRDRALAPFGPLRRRRAAAETLIP